MCVCRYARTVRNRLCTASHSSCPIPTPPSPSSPIPAVPGDVMCPSWHMNPDVWQGVGRICSSQGWCLKGQPSPALPRPPPASLPITEHARLHRHVSPPVRQRTYAYVYICVRTCACARAPLPWLWPDIWTGVSPANVGEGLNLRLLPTPSLPLPPSLSPPFPPPRVTCRHEEDPQHQPQAGLAQLGSTGAGLGAHPLS